MVSTTSARPSGARPDVLAKMTSSIFPPRSVFAPCSPITQLKASTTLDLPEPLGPTTQVMPGSKLRVVADAKDLNPRKVRLLRYNVPPLDGVSSGEDPAEGDLTVTDGSYEFGHVAGRVPDCWGPRSDCQTPAVGCSLSR